MPGISDEGGFFWRGGGRGLKSRAGEWAICAFKLGSRNAQPSCEDKFRPLLNSIVSDTLARASSGLYNREITHILNIGYSFGACEWTG